MTKKEEIIKRIENLTEKQFEMLIALFLSSEQGEHKEAICESRN